MSKFSCKSISTVIVPIIILATICGSTDIASAALKSGDLIVSTYSSDTSLQTIWDVDPVSGQKQQITQSNIGIYNNGMAMTPEGRLFIVQDQIFRVIELNLQNGSFNFVAGNGMIGNPRDMAAAKDNSLWILDGANIYHLDPNTSILLDQFSAYSNSQLNVSNPGGIGIEPDGSLLKTYMTSINTNDGAVVKFNPATGIEDLIYAPLDNPYSVVSDQNGHVYLLDEHQVGNTATHYLRSIDESTNAISSFQLDIGVAVVLSKLAFSPGNGLYTSDLSTGGGIWHIDAATGDQTLLTTFSDTDHYRIVGFTVVPVPEPAMLTLAAVCSICLLGYKFCRK
jgi:outer membrane protein assembly factor BamB